MRRPVFVSGEEAAAMIESGANVATIGMTLVSLLIAFLAGDKEGAKFHLNQSLVIILFCWLCFKAIGLALTLTWGAAKILAALLFAIAVPVLFACLLFAGGAALFLPVILIAGAYGIVKGC